MGDGTEEFEKLSLSVEEEEKKLILWWASIWVDHFQDLIQVFSYVVETPYNLKFDA